MTVVPPGGAIGILGGGQLGRMLAQAASQLGFDVHIYTDEKDSPASRVAAKTIVGDYHDHKALADFARHVDVVTSEFENVPADTAAALVDAGARVAPNPKALAVAQDRFIEKSFFNDNDVPTVPFAAIDSEADLAKAVDRMGLPAILKTRRLGYDGQGQVRLTSMDDVRGAHAKIGGAPAILEGFCRFEKEISIIAARGMDGSFAAYDLCENTHDHGILARTVAPAFASELIVVEARAEAQRVMDMLDYVGVMAIEFFLTPEDLLLANEMAPRVHNSGHWTIEGAATSQFEQHIRAIAGWPLGSTERLFDCEMRNLIGGDVDNWRALAADPHARVHLYGKREAREGRKMGHVTRLVTKRR